MVTVDRPINEEYLYTNISALSTSEVLYPWIKKRRGEGGIGLRT